MHALDGGTWGNREGGVRGAAERRGGGRWRSRAPRQHSVAGSRKEHVAPASGRLSCGRPHRRRAPAPGARERLGLEQAAVRREPGAIRAAPQAKRAAAGRKLRPQDLPALADGVPPAHRQRPREDDDQGGVGEAADDVDGAPALNRERDGLARRGRGGQRASAGAEVDAPQLAANHRPARDPLAAPAQRDGGGRAPGQGPRQALPGARIARNEDAVVRRQGGQARDRGDTAHGARAVPGPGGDLRAGDTAFDAVEAARARGEQSAFREEGEIQHRTAVEHAPERLPGATDQHPPLVADGQAARSGLDGERGHALAAQTDQRRPPLQRAQLARFGRARTQGQQREYRREPPARPLRVVHAAAEEQVACRPMRIPRAAQDREPEKVFSSAGRRRRTHVKPRSHRPRQRLATFGGRSLA
jgi:hypothetical protein